MDSDWAINQLEQWLQLHVAQRAASRIADQGGPLDLRFDERLESGAVVVGAILHRATPAWGAEVPSDDWDRWGQRTQAVRRALTVLRRQAELEAKLGDDSPTLDAGSFHPWAWEGARSMWGSQQYAQAVVDALKKVNAETQLKAGRRDVSETDLFSQLFSLDPPKTDRPRLRLMAEDGSDTYSSVHRGARTFAEGLFAGIRNRHSHEVTDTPAEEQHALEQLAAVSVLARWVDDAEVVTAP